MGEIAWYAVHIVLLIIVLYVVVRVVSIAHYRTRAEYDDRRRVRDFLANNNGDGDAKR